MMDHDMAGASQNPQAPPETMQLTEEQSDAPTNAGVSMASATSHSSDLADESAVQNLDIDYSEDNDSALGDMSMLTSTMSMNSSIYNYVQENGRSYHRYKEGKYMLPNDEEEMDRLDLQHQLWLITLNDQLFLSPITSPRNVLDIGTGTGIWAIELASKFPSATVIGSDLSPIQPSFIPPNCRFEVDDAEDAWSYTQKFDLIHGRMLVTCFRDPKPVIQSAFDQLESGGYLEFQDIVIPMRDVDGSLEGTAIEKWMGVTLEAARGIGLTWTQSANYERYFEEVGFVEVVEEHFQWPMNTWAKGDHMKTLGSYWLENLTRALEGLSMAALTRGGGYTREQVIELCDAAKIDLRNRAIHAYCPGIVVYGRKP